MFHEQKSARNKFHDYNQFHKDRKSIKKYHEQKSTRSKFHEQKISMQGVEQNYFHEEKMNVQVSRREISRGNKIH